MALPHGHNNRTFLQDSIVIKEYEGTDAPARLKRETIALRSLQGILPVPHIVHCDAVRNVLRITRLPGVNGEWLLGRGFAAQVLDICGNLLRRLRSISPQVMIQGLPGDGPVIVHGDFGPQSLGCAR